jgi:hypothetical protein
LSIFFLLFVVAFVSLVVVDLPMIIPNYVYSSWSKTSIVIIGSYHRISNFISTSTCLLSSFNIFYFISKILSSGFYKIFASILLSPINLTYRKSVVTIGGVLIWQVDSIPNISHCQRRNWMPDPRTNSGSLLLQHTFPKVEGVFLDPPVPALSPTKEVVE